MNIVLFLQGIQTNGTRQHIDITLKISGIKEGFVIAIEG